MGVMFQNKELASNKGYELSPDKMKKFKESLEKAAVNTAKEDSLMQRKDLNEEVLYKLDYSEGNLSKLTALELFNYGKFKKLFSKYPIRKDLKATAYNRRQVFVSKLVLAGEIVFPEGANLIADELEGANSENAYSGTGMQNEIVKKWLIENHHKITEDGEYLGN